MLLVCCSWSGSNVCFSSCRCYAFMSCVHPIAVAELCIV